jgi:hypothetical protein
MLFRYSEMIAEKIIIYLTDRKIKYLVYALTALVIAIFGAASLILTLDEKLPETSLPFDTKRVCLSAKVKITEKEREIFDPREELIPPFYAQKIPRYTTKTIRKTFCHLDLRYPLEIYEEDTCEISIVATKRDLYSNHVLFIEPQLDIIQIKFLCGKSLVFIPDTLTIPFHWPNPHLAYFESERVSKPVDKKVLIQGRLISSDFTTETDLNNKKPPFENLGNIEIRIHPKKIIFGMTESTLKGIQMLFGALGVPAILLSIVTFLAKKIVSN